MALKKRDFSCWEIWNHWRCSDCFHIFVERIDKIYVPASLCPGRFMPWYTERKDKSFVPKRENLIDRKLVSLALKTVQNR